LYALLGSVFVSFKAKYFLNAIEASPFLNSFSIFKIINRRSKKLFEDADQGTNHSLRGNSPIG
jgi:hypothetical protein